MRIGAIALALLLVPTSATAFCFEPTAPHPPGIGVMLRPSPPYCLNSFGSTPCESWEIDAYVNDVNSYIRQLSGMVDRANDFAREAARYADDVYDYAVCEAEGAKEGLR